MQFSIPPEQQKKYVEANQPRVQEKLDEPVLAWSLFVRTGSYGAMAAEYVSGIAGTVINLIGKKRAGGLPPRFLLVVTPTKVRAFKFAQKRSGLRVGDELAVWDRAQLHVTANETALTMRVTLQSAADDERVVCDTGKGDFTDGFLRAIDAATAGSHAALGTATA
jgi:hypothetical protein